MRPLESRFVKFAENKCAYIYLYNSHPQMRLRSKEITKVKDFAQAVARNLQLDELTVDCNFINQKWQLNFIFLPLGNREKLINIPCAMLVNELYRSNIDRIAEDIADCILATAQRITGQQTLSQEFFGVNFAQSDFNEFLRLNNTFPDTAARGIYNQKCKYFNGGDYLRCAVNPDGACDRCGDFKAKRQ